MTLCTPEYNAKTREMMDQLEKLKATAAKLAKPAAQNKAAMTRLSKQEAELKAKVEAGHAEKAPPREKPVYNEAVFEAQARVNKLKGQVDSLIKRGERVNASPVVKTMGFAHNMHMMDILSSPLVYGKLLSAVVGGHIEAITSAASRSFAKAAIPGVRGVAEKAGRYGQGLTYGGLLERLRGLAKAPKGMLEQFKHGESQLEMTHGNPAAISDEYTQHLGTLREAIAGLHGANKAIEGFRWAASLPGRTHAMVKELLTVPEFYHSYFDRGNQLRGQLEKAGKTPEQIEEFMGRESTRATLGAKAMEDAYEAKMQGKNKIGDKLSGLITQLDNSPDIGPKTLGFVLKSIFPIRRIGMNIAKEVTSLSVGGLKALAESAKGGEMTPERADYIMKNIGKQGTGAALLAVGIVYNKLFGGVPQPGDKKRHAAIKPEEGKIGDTDIPSQIFHGAPASMLQLGAGIAHVFQREVGKEGATEAALEAIAGNYKEWFERTIPYTDQARRMSNTMQYGRGAGEVLGNQIRSMTVPQIVQQEAKREDPRKGYPKPRNIKEDIESGIPGLRKNVPVR
jgi:hypothetical protein